MVITLYTGGVINFGFTAVFDPLIEEFGWSSAQISLAASLRGLEVGLLSAVVGLMVDRLGPRKLIIGGSILVTIGYLILSQVSSLAMFYLAFALISLGMSACAGTVLLTAVTHWFNRKAGIATGIVASGFGLGGIIVPIVTTLIDKFDWRPAMIMIAIGTVIVCIPLALLVRHRPEDYGYLPDGDTVAVEKSQAAIEKQPEANYTIWQALRDRAFWHVSISSSCHSFVIGAVVTHVMPYLGSVGVGRSTASLIALFLPLASVIGRLSCGTISAKTGNRAVYTTSFILMTVGLLCFSQVKSANLWLVIPFILVFSLGWGFSVISRITLLREHYGRASFGAVIGFNSTIMMIGNISGAPIAGWSYDHFGSYQGAWIAFGIVTLGGMVLALTTPPRKNTKNEILSTKN
jgi:sugar phosphate permease